MSSHDPLVPPDSAPPGPGNGFRPGGFPTSDFAPGAVPGTGETGINETAMADVMGAGSGQAPPPGAPALPPVAPAAPFRHTEDPLGGRTDPPIVVVPSLTEGSAQAPVTVNNPEMVVGKVDHMHHHRHQETRKQDVLEGAVLSRETVRRGPLVRAGQWNQVWKQALDLEAAPARLREPVLVIVAPRSYGSTTLALHLLAETTDDRVPLVKLDADWRTPKAGRLPLELRHAYQLDLKDAENDKISADFLDNLSHHSKKLGELGSTLVLAVDKDLWNERYAPARPGIHVVHLTEPPPAREVVEAHLRARQVPGLVPYLHSGGTAKDSLAGRDAVEAVRAAETIVLAWLEHVRLTGTELPMDEVSWGKVDDELSARITAALSDWRDKLDVLFGESVSTHRGKDSSLPLEDRCLLLALAVRQSAPMPQVARAARSLRNIITTNDADKGGFTSTPEAVFAGRGLRRRVVDAGARVDTQDNVVFDQPGYGGAVLTYVWDNYEIMRAPLLKWLVGGGEGAGDGERVVDALSVLTLRHGSTPRFGQLGPLARTGRKEVLSAVMTRAVRDEHAGRQAWGTLYGWASGTEYASTVISICRGVLGAADVTSSQARMAMVRLRRVANHTRDEAALAEVLDAFEDLARRPDGVERLVSEVHAWQQPGKSGKAGPLAFLALMPVGDDFGPWLLTDDARQKVGVEEALRTLLGDVATAPDAITRITDWVRASSADPTAYARIRDQLLPALRGQRMFKASMALMKALAGVPLEEGATADEDFWDRLVDPRVRTVFPLARTSA
ncbi:hypothetical protein ACIQNV_38880 [Streptomyces hydrogenans]|uniref:hypothetical protein n=1 Tax=Streptomyces hydrogenans TaxID=1873719 RepID=UPI003448B5C5